MDAGLLRNSAATLIIVLLTAVSASGCGGSLDGFIFTTVPLSIDCAVNVVFDAPDGGLKLAIERVSLIQVTQTPDGTVPIAANREALLRVFPWQMPPTRRRPSSGSTCTTAVRK